MSEVAKTFSVELKGRGDQWPRLEPEVLAFGEANEWPPDLGFAIRLILEELVLNAVFHGSDDGSTVVRLNMESDSDTVRLELMDNGRAFNPLEDTPAPDLESDVEDRLVGGLGVHLVKTMADELEYERVDGFNKVIVVKRRDT